MSVITWLADEKVIVALSVATNMMYSRFFVNGEWRDWVGSNEEQIIVTKIPAAETYNGRITVTKMGKVVIISFANFFLTTQERGFVVASGLPRNDTGEIVLTTLFPDVASDSFSNSRCCAYLGSGQTQLLIHEFSPNVGKYGNIVYFTND